MSLFILNVLPALQSFLCISEEEISNMRLELDKYGIQMPAFSKIGGILANELSVDEAACKWKWDFILCEKLNCQIRQQLHVALLGLMFLIHCAHAVCEWSILCYKI